MSVQTDEIKKHFNRLYKEVSANVAAARAEVFGLKVDHEEGKKEIGGMLEKLQDIQSRFDSELALLEQHAEWDKFTIAFFGETNAGKSTIIDSLRILFNEESRQELLEENNHDLARYEAALAQRIQQVREAMKALYEAHATEFKNLRLQVAVLAQILEKESAARIYLAKEESSTRSKILEEEAAARNRIIEEEASNRNRIAREESLERNRILEDESTKKVEIAKEEASARVRKKQALTGVLCIIAGVALAVPITLLVVR
jgi:ABC-type arginine transport system ATPase subunit